MCIKPQNIYRNCSFIFIFSVVAYGIYTVKASLKSFISSVNVFIMVFGKIQCINHNSNILPIS